MREVPVLPDTEEPDKLLPPEILLSDKLLLPVEKLLPLAGWLVLPVLELLKVEPELKLLLEVLSKLLPELLPVIFSIVLFVSLKCFIYPIKEINSLLSDTFKTC